MILPKLILQLRLSLYWCLCVDSICPKIQLREDGTLKISLGQNFLFLFKIIGCGFLLELPSV